MSQKDQGLKRLLSPESVNTIPGKVIDKKRRQDSIVIITDTMEPLGTAELDLPPLLSDLKKCMDVILTTAKKEDLSELATKLDMKVLDDRISAQGQEISQLRDELKSIRTYFNSLQETVDRQLMVNINGSKGHDPKGRVRKQRL